MELIKVTVPWKPLHIVPLGDVQFAGRDHFSVATSRLREDVQKALEYEKQGHTVRFVGMGDYIDFMSPSNRARTEAATLYDTAIDILDATSLYLNQELVEMALKPTDARWLGLLEGHHYRKLDSGATSDMELCKTLHAKFLGDSALIHVVVSDGTHRVPITLWVHHGTGNGATGYYPLMRLEKVYPDWEDVDIFMIGHTTKQGLTMKNRLRPRWNVRGKPDLVHRTVRLVGTGGYSKAYVEHARRGGRPEGGYPEKKMLNPSVLGAPIIHVIPRFVHGGGPTLDITVEG